MTRAVSISFTLYNPNVQVFGMANFVFEFTASSAVLGTSDLVTIKAFKYILFTLSF
jgi:hypothetical protein